MKRYDVVNADPEDDGVRMHEQEHPEGRWVHAVEAMKAIAKRDAMLRRYRGRHNEIRNLGHHRAVPVVCDCAVCIETDEVIG